jgi:hypothetical protein
VHGRYPCNTSPGEYSGYRIFLKERRCNGLLASLASGEERGWKDDLGSVAFYGVGIEEKWYVPATTH